MSPRLPEKLTTLLLAAALLLTAAATAGERNSPPEQEPQPVQKADIANSSESQLTLGAALQRALTHNPQLAGTEADIGAARARLGQAESAALPRLDLSAGHTLSNNPVNAFGFKLSQDRFTESDLRLPSLNDPATTQQTTLKLSLEYPVYTFGKIEGRIDAADAAVSSSRLVSERTRHTVAGNTVKAYLSTVLAGAKVEVLESAVDSARERVRVTQNFYDNGVIVKSELLSAQAYLSEVRGQLDGAKAEQVAAREKLRRVLGGELKTDTELAAGLPELYRIARSKQHWLNAAYQQRSDLRALEEQDRALKGRMRSAEGESKPTLALFSEYRYSDKGAFSQGSDDYTVGLRITQPLSDGGMAEAKRDEVESRRKGLEARREGLRQQIGAEVRSALAELTAARSRLDSARTGVEQAREALRITSDRFREGLAIGTEVREAETRLRKARLSRLAAKYDWHAAAVDLFLAGGDYAALRDHYPGGSDSEESS